IRKNILKFDNVMNDQRKVVFERRREIMAEESVEETIGEMREGVLDRLVSTHIPRDAYAEAWDVEGLHEAVVNVLGIDAPVADWAKEEGIADEEMLERLIKAANDAYAERVEKNSPDVMRYVEKQIILQVLDHLWREHLVVLDHLRQVIGWRGYAQRDPLNEYKSEALDLFRSMMERWDEITTGQTMRVEVAFEPAPNELPEMEGHHIDASTGEDEMALAEINARIAAGDFSPQALMPSQAMSASARDPNDPSSWGKVSRNEACPCGSGKKYKHCHGALV
ncbi:MAG TPA: SEC-C metal-binding domain-containing protein, partial [Rhodoblastus sp.]|nr:SEC-C metal-binding domain-containing protein [Rhodoblastus sp.]